MCMCAFEIDHVCFFCCCTELVILVLLLSEYSTAVLVNDDY